MKPFLTRYQVGGHTFGSQLWAEDRKDAERLVKLRGLGEVVTVESLIGGERRASTVLVMPDVSAPYRIHALTFLCWLGIKSGGTSVDEVLGDMGLLHQWIHCELWPKVRNDASILPKRELLRMVKQLEDKIPGYKNE